MWESGGTRQRTKRRSEGRARNCGKVEATRQGRREGTRCRSDLIPPSQTKTQTKGGNELGPQSSTGGHSKSHDPQRRGLGSGATPLGRRACHSKSHDPQRRGLGSGATPLSNDARPSCRIWDRAMSPIARSNNGASRRGLSIAKQRLVLHRPVNTDRCREVSGRNLALPRWAGIR